MATGRPIPSRPKAESLNHRVRHIFELCKSLLQIENAGNSFQALETSHLQKTISRRSELCGTRHFTEGKLVIERRVLRFAPYVA